jgi:hypothetical protein
VIAIIVDILRPIIHALAPIVAAATALLAQPYDFGHRTHLTMRLACVRCHPGAPKSTQPPAVGEATFSSDACLDCHGRAILNLRPAPAPPIAHFNHALHLALKDQTCGACHHGLLETDKVTGALFPSMAECLVCHQQVNPPRSCYRCHEQDDPRLQPQKPASGTSPGR